MTEYDNTNRGVAFPNKRKSQPTHADYSGSLNVEGKEYSLNIWVKKNQDGSTRLSVGVKEKAPLAAAPRARDPLDGEIPF